MIVAYKDHHPQLGAECFVAPDAWLIGDVTLGDRCGVFFGSVVRGDIQPIRVGNESNIQDLVVIHTSRGRTPTELGEQVSIGHRATLHGCRVEDCCLIGMGSIILDETVIGEGSMVGAGTVVTERKKFPPRSLILGSPGRVVRTLEDHEVDFIRGTAQAYLDKRNDYLKMKLA